MTCKRQARENLYVSKRQEVNRAFLFSVENTSTHAHISIKKWNTHAPKSIANGMRNLMHIGVEIAFRICWRQKQNQQWNSKNNRKTIRVSLKFALIKKLECISSSSYVWWTESERNDFTFYLSFSQLHRSDKQNKTKFDEIKVKLKSRQIKFICIRIAIITNVRISAWNIFKKQWAKNKTKQRGCLSLSLFGLQPYGLEC